MATQSLIPAGDYRTTYAADTTIFPTAGSRYAVWAGLAVLCIAPLVLDRYWLSLLIQIGYFAVAALGLNILVGYCGQISLGTGAFMAVGAYAAYNFTARIDGMPLVVAILLGGVSPVTLTRAGRIETDDPHRLARVFASTTTPRLSFWY